MTYCPPVGCSTILTPPRLVPLTCMRASQFREVCNRYQIQLYHKKVAFLEPVNLVSSVIAAGAGKPNIGLVGFEYGREKREI